MTRIQSWSLDREEKLSEFFALPHGRRVEAVLQSLSVARAAGAHPEGERLALVLEVKQPGAADFTEVACTPWLAVGPEEGAAKLLVPTNPEPLKAGQHPGVFRLRLVHEGRLQPHIQVQLLGM